MITGNKIYFFLFLILVPVFLNAQNRTGLLNTPIKITHRKGLISSFLSQVEQTGILLTYNPDNIRMNRKITLSSRIKTVGELLEEVLRAESIQIKEYEGKILLISNPRLITLSGFIKEEGSAEVIIGANITETESQSIAVTNGFGFYSISLEKGDYELTITHTGYAPVILKVNLNGESIRKDIFLKSGVDLPELVVTKSNESRNNLNVGGDHVDLEAANKLPSFLGEKDVIRAIQLYPGVSGNTGGSVSMFVRGGNADQNLVTLDDISIYNINHFNGMFSIFNPDVLKSVDFYRSDFPSKYGGRLSSVLNVRSKDGNMEKYHGHSTIGLLFASTGLEGPIIKDKASFSLNTRRSWLDLLGAKALEDAGLYYYFLDLNLKLNYIANPNNRFYISTYLGNDSYRQKLDFSDESNDSFRSTLKWGNRLVAFRWNSILSPRLFKNTTATFSQYRNSLDANLVSSLVGLPKRVYTTVKDYGLKSDFNYYLRPDLKLNFGAGVSMNSFIFPVGLSTEESITINTLNFDAYIEDEVKIGSHAEFTAGWHYTGFKNGNTIYHTLQPRIRFSYRLGDNQVITASYSRMAQFIHQFTTNGLSVPTEFRIPSSKNIKPETSEILNLSYRLQAGKTSTFTVEAYLKNMDNLLALGAGQDIANGYFARKIEDRLASGRGNSKGIEFSYVQQLNWLRFQMAYTLSKTTGQFKALNLGQSFPLDQDLRHNFNLAVNASLGKRLEISALWTYITGRHVTVPQTTHKSIDDVLGSASSPDTYVISGLNNYTLAQNYKLDLGLNLTRKFSNGHQRIWTLGMYNAIANSSSAYLFVSVNSQSNKVNILEEAKLKLIPYFTFTYKF
ncbi:TonB-dependent receptor [Pedobacter cryoconitis]|uniref:Outer membrane receptor for ferrienterochelin and colicin n=1 Tax=Pedobacter cryoconitis TaxID=188932 RepID=A0A327SSF3_9SPHI|nr:carboxypeptidase-like regulatory domain-containing protein [Pedobacter cryoconitis]RAJ32226.1 outer membrane receptor for ferrienterochelin and colicin [Pedobacter cryoconitis]